MRLNHTQRLRIAHMIREQLPWAHIIVGASGHNFIEVSRGESIKGSYSTGKKIGHMGSAWSRGWPGSYCLHVNIGEGWAEYRRRMEPMRGESEWMVVCKMEIVPAFECGATVPERIKAVADWLVSRAANMPEAPRYDRLLRKGETFDVRRWELEPAMSAGRKAVRQ